MSSGIACSIYSLGFSGVEGARIGRYLSDQLGLVCKTRPVWVEKAKRDRNAKCRFSSEVSMEQLTRLTENALEYNGQVIKCELVAVGDHDASPSAKRTKTAELPKPATDLTIEQLVLPLLHVQSLEQQRSDKRKRVEEALNGAYLKVKKVAEPKGYAPMFRWTDLVVEDTLFVPNQRGYRNKCEFAIGTNSEGAVEVGFTLKRATATTEPVIEKGDHLMHVSVDIGRIVEELRNLVTLKVSEYPLFSHVSKQGFWRVVMVRCCPVTLESQVVIQVGACNEEEKRKKFEHMISQWVGGLASPITSLYLQYSSAFTDSFSMEDGLHEMVLLSGPATIRMAVGTSLELAVHPLSFFQTNSAACELLYDKVASLVAATEDRTLFDVCCGVGSIGQYVVKKGQGGDSSLAPRISVVGVDVVESAIADAKNNALRNNITECRYVVGRAEDVLGEELNHAGDAKKITVDAKISCIVDPPRSGLHKSVIRAIRECEQIESLVYVSCNPRSLEEDLVLFCVPQVSCPEEEGIACNMRFEPVYGVAVDMFPNTVHCETVVLLRRARRGDGHDENLCTIERQ